LYDQTDTSRALMQMFEATGEQRYLNAAGEILRRVFSLVSADGRYVRQFANEEPRYTGMAQGIIIRELDAYHGHSGERWAAEALTKMVQAFQHTNEGSWNHWTNSLIGQLIAERYGVVSDTAKARWHYDFQLFMAQIRRRGGGHIPGVTNPKNPSWAKHFPTYHPFDLMLLLMLAEREHYARPWVCQMFPAAFAIAKQSEGIYQIARNAHSAKMAREICQIDTSDYLDYAATQLIDNPTNVNDAVATLILAAALVERRLTE